MNKIAVKNNKKIIRKLIVVIGLDVALFVHVVTFDIIFGEPLTSSYAFQDVVLRQNIKAVNPFKQGGYPKSRNLETNAYANSEYRMIVPIDSAADALLPDQNNTVETNSPIITLTGDALFPNSYVVLEIRSDPFYVSVLADQNGKWNWTNYGHALEYGTHTIRAYNFSPYQISGNRDVFPQVYFLKVIEGGLEESLGIPNLYLKNPGHVSRREGEGSDDVSPSESEILRGYLFTSELAGNKEYYQGETVNVRFTFNPIGKTDTRVGQIEYQVYYLDKNNVKNNELVGSFEDQIFLDTNGGSFLKKLNIREDSMPGEYIIKVVGKVDGREYVGSTIVTLLAKPVITVGSVTMDRNNFEYMFLGNTLFVFFLIFIIFSTILLEYERYFIYKPIDSSHLLKYLK